MNQGDRDSTALPDGRYDQLLTESLRRALERVTDEHSRTIAPPCRPKTRCA